MSVSMTMQSIYNSLDKLEKRTLEFMLYKEFVGVESYEPSSNVCHRTSLYEELRNRGIVVYKGCFAADNKEFLRFYSLSNSWRQWLKRHERRA